MCSLDLAQLVVGRVWGIKDMFVLAAKRGEKFYYDICCFPADRGRNTWLECLMMMSFICSCRNKI
jgi:hypothetical protein